MHPSTQPPVVATRRGSLLHLELNMPEKKNLMNQAVFDGIRHHLLEAEKDPAVRVLLLSGRGDVFCGGGDLNEFIREPLSGGFTRTPVYQCMVDLSFYSKPIVAAVHGAAVGGGATLLLSCDIVVAAEDTSFLFPFTQLGICPELGSTYLLPLAVGMRRASEWLLMAEPVDAREARDAGLVNKVVAAGDLMTVAERYAGRLAELPPRSLRATKRLLQQAHMAAVNAAYIEEFRELERSFQGGELREAVAAFFEKRKPDFSRFQ